MTPKKAPERWEVSVGYVPYKVTVYERADKGDVLYLRWRADGDWKRESLGTTLPRDAKGKPDARVQTWAQGKAQAKADALVADAHADPAQPTPIAAAVPAKRRIATMREARAAILDPATGKYPTDTMHRREVLREWDRAMALFGDGAHVEHLDRAAMRRLWRHRITALRAANAIGLRGAEVTIVRVLSVLRWLKDEELVRVIVDMSSRWKDQLRSDWMELTAARVLPEPRRPRYTITEARRLIDTAIAVDPRLHLALTLGAELRMQQVVRARRADLDLAKGLFRVYGRGKKRGTLVELTAGQRAVVEHYLTHGYLWLLESTCADYPLFPAGPLRGARAGRPPVAGLHQADAQPIGMTAMRRWFRETERLADVAHVEGRGLYGLKRVSVDAANAAHISRHGLKAFGGWADTQTPDRIYADADDAAARGEARRIRAIVRGEAVGADTETEPETEPTRNGGPESGPPSRGNDA